MGRPTLRDNGIRPHGGGRLGYAARFGEDRGLRQRVARWLWAKLCWDDRAVVERRNKSKKEEVQHEYGMDGAYCGITPGEDVSLWRRRWGVRGSDHSYSRRTGHTSEAENPHEPGLLAFAQHPSFVRERVLSARPSPVGLPLAFDIENEEQLNDILARFPGTEFDITPAPYEDAEDEDDDEDDTTLVDLDADFDADDNSLCTPWTGQDTPEEATSPGPVFGQGKRYRMTERMPSEGEYYTASALGRDGRIEAFVVTMAQENPVSGFPGFVAVGAETGIHGVLLEFVRGFVDVYADYRCEGEQEEVQEEGEDVEDGQEENEHGAQEEGRDLDHAEEQDHNTQQPEHTGSDQSSMSLAWNSHINIIFHAQSSTSPSSLRTTITALNLTTTPHPAFLLLTSNPPLRAPLRERKPHVQASPSTVSEPITLASDAHTAQGFYSASLVLKEGYRIACPFPLQRLVSNKYWACIAQFVMMLFVWGTCFQEEAQWGWETWTAILGVVVAPPLKFLAGKMERWGVAGIWAEVRVLVEVGMQIRRDQKKGRVDRSVRDFVLCVGCWKVRTVLLRAERALEKGIGMCRMWKEGMRRASGRMYGTRSVLILVAVLLLSLVERVLDKVLCMCAKRRCIRVKIGGESVEKLI